MLELLWDVKKKGMPKVGFVGFGVSCRGVYEALRGELTGAVTRVRSKTPTDVPEGLSAVFGEKYLDRIGEDILVISPGIRHDLPPLLEAAERGCILSSDADLFFRRSERNVFAVTGSDGKSTTVSLAGHLLRCGGRFPSVSVCGNIGLPFCQAAVQNAEGGAFCAELSSFMLQDLSPRSKRAVITNLTPNHADWHLSPDEYREAKLGVFKNTEEPVGNADQPEVLPKGGCYALFSVKLDVRELSRRADVLYTLKDGFIQRNGEDLLPLSGLSLSGESGVKNTLAALCLTEGYIEKEILPSACGSFSPLPHRAECVATVAGVKFADSSIDSTPSRTAATLRGYESGVWLLLGGRGKNVSLDPLFPEIALRCRGAILFGEIAKEAKEFLESRRKDLPKPFPVVVTERMADAVRAAAAMAEPGDTVLLSPAATSFDEFKNYEERGISFRRTVEALSL
ncbi:MAG: UDP-N-acetylmuramoyl-L-alanine--D-glutamate ligase [Clostridia bacterium]|nr:UDP-N-acetylmuramoyl-L-alanine--D-glutamate ligase [Clostridia bacterium]